MNESPLTGLFPTFAAAAGLFLAFAATLALPPSVRAWCPPALAVLGLGFAAGRGAWGGAAVVAWAGALFAAAGHSPVGPAVAVGAALTFGLRSLNLAPARRWALAGGLGWVWAGATAVLAGGAWAEPASLPAALLLGTACGGIAAAIRGDRRIDRGWA